MINFFSNIEIEKQSFWLGFIAGAILIWFIFRLLKYLPGAIKFIKQKFLESRASLTSTAELRYRNEILQHLQKLHITSSIFSLDEIVIPPRLLTPSKPVDLENQFQPDAITQLTIPYMPDWPEMAATYKAPTLSVFDALSQDANLVIIGQPGSGRTVSLAYLASSLLRKDIEDAKLGNLVPIYIHAQDISQTQVDTSPLNTLIDVISSICSGLNKQKLSSLFTSIFSRNRALLLIDGLDEISENHYQTVKEFLRNILSVYPELRIVATSSPEIIEGLPQIGLIPISVAAWDDQMINTFVNTFSHLWRVTTQAGEDSEEDQYDALIIQNWLKNHNMPQGPLELTLRVWSSFAGDMLGPDFGSNIEAYIRRTTLEMPEARSILEQLAIHLILGQKLIFEQEDIHRLMEQQRKSGQTQEKIIYEEPEINIADNEVIDPDVKPSQEIKIKSVIQSLTNSGLLITDDNQLFTFSHVVIPAYLAGGSITKNQDISFILQQNDWAGKILSIGHYLNFNGEAEHIINRYIDWDYEDILHNKILTAARWLKTSSNNHQWRKRLIRYLALKLQNESVTLISSGRFLSALALSNDPHIRPLFRQLLSSEDINIRQLAILGCGLIKDTKSVAAIATLINDMIPSVSRAACLALVAIGDKNAMETIATVLLQGGETTRRNAAEALANNREEGHPALRDGSKMEDLLIRRAVVFGLARINEKWANEILDELQLEDQQWLVRNAAIQALEERKRPKSYTPTPSIPLTDTTWLIDFASKLGIGVAPGKPAIELLIRALKDGDEGLRLEALNYLRLNGFQEVIPTIIDVYQRSLGEVREVAFDTLWHLSASGYDISGGK